MANILRANLIKIQSVLRGSGARPLTRQPRATNARSIMYKKDKADGTSSTLTMTPQTWAALGGLLAVAVGYGYMMSHPDKVIRSESSPASTTEVNSGDATRKTPEYLKGK
ncbi:uncharacterized protein B0T15DRAFT_552080 [Chaetomium strumarium]|uniref:Uncharacterized protein n=1 Tax=Chaetomium strumarium TaxID=1170767 RepID=A0AAJ0M290_9PEZI|nr:hypothetical protein B0T15DRAFT_552080 [Chaetomium strumarium]